jgi:CDP-diacylglycerol pyrophosphatase
LWGIVDSCVDRESAHYCACPAFAQSCCGKSATADADVVWATTKAFVAIRDMQMCGCQAGFVSGLAMPRTWISGIEDPRRPEGIWPFAWDAARTRIGDENQIGLVINPTTARTQLQMHVHLQRLRPEVRASLDSADAPPFQGTVVLRLPTLDAVFAAAEARVGAAGMAETGILVARSRHGGWVALLSHGTSPESFTISRCRELAPPSAG